MTENTITGYRHLESPTIATVNTIKAQEAMMAVLWAQVVVEVDSQFGALGMVPLHNSEHEEAKRQLALARTKFEEGFMHMVRAVARPKDVWAHAQNLARQEMLKTPKPT